MVAAELLTVVSLAAVVLGLVMFSPPVTLVVFAFAFIVVALLSFVLHRRAVSGAGRLRCMLAVALILLAAVSPFFLCDESQAMVERIEDRKSVV